MCGIAEVLARPGWTWSRSEQDAESAEAAAGTWPTPPRAVRRGKLTEGEQAELLSRIAFSTDLEDMKDVELGGRGGALERLDLKRDIFAGWTAICPPDTILATTPPRCR